MCHGAEDGTTDLLLHYPNGGCNRYGQPTRDPSAVAYVLETTLESILGALVSFVNV